MSKAGQTAAITKKKIMECLGIADSRTLAKTLFRFGIVLPKGKVILTPIEAENITQKLGIKFNQ